MLTENTASSISVAVNGSGTIGRSVLVEMVRSPTCQFNLTAVNDKLEIAKAAQLLEHVFFTRLRQQYRVTTDD